MKLRFHLRGLFFVTTLLSVVLAYFSYDRAQLAHRKRCADILKKNGFVLFEPDPYATDPNRPYSDWRQPAGAISVTGDAFQFTEFGISPMTVLDDSVASTEARDRNQPPNPWLLSDAELATAAMAFPETKLLSITARQQIDHNWAKVVDRLVELEELTIAAGHIDEQVASAITRRKRLKKLEVRFAPLPPGFFRELAELPSLESLVVSVYKTGFDEAALMELAKIDSLTAR